MASSLGARSPPSRFLFRRSLVSSVCERDRANFRRPLGAPPWSASGRNWLGGRAKCGHRVELAGVSLIEFGAHQFGVAHFCHPGLWFLALVEHCARVATANTGHLALDLAIWDGSWPAIGRKQTSTRD